MSEYFDQETGEIVDATDAEAVDISSAAIKRHEAAEQEKAWGARKAIFDSILLKNQNEKNAVYGEQVQISIRNAGYETFDQEGFAEAVQEIELTREELVALVLAAKGFSKDKLPPDVQLIVNDFTTKLQKKPWVLSSVVRKIAPDVKN